MDTPSVPPPTPTTTPPLSPAAYVRSRHTVWMSSAALLTDAAGRVLIVRPGDRADGRWLLPGGGVEAGESPWQGCRREVHEETGLHLAPERAALLVTCWFAVEDREPLRDLGFPGDVMTVFDGGTVSDGRAARLRCADGEIAEYAFCDSLRAAELLTPLSARVMLAALRARLGGTGPVYLESGRHVGTPPPLDLHDVHVRPHSGPAWSWHPGEPVPEGLPVTQAWGWLFVPDGRVLLVFQRHPEARMRLVMLPGGTVEDEDAGPEATLRREVAEEANAELGPDVLPLGWLHDPTGRAQEVDGRARMRLTAAVTRIGPARPDPATGDTFVRLLATPTQAAELLRTEDSAGRQVTRAAHLARTQWGIPTPPHGPVAEVPREGMTW
ncbi:NUDIX hydrolase [Streptomyces sp. ODS28]|uniref:NUDIX hydrolase n=1 Tax=Streptomyces sp. ODS28 TaxID=3136688 RepID=UPI0031E5C0F0